MKILAIEKEVSGVSKEDFEPMLKAEASTVWELHQAGVFRELYFHRDKHVAILMLECAALEEARTVLATLPLVKAGLITFDLMPLVPYSGFSRLFEKEA
jgi:hypothetical protein